LLTVIATLEAKTGKEVELERELLALTHATLEEEGCINYDLLRALEKPGKFVFYENWATREDLERHLATDHMKAFAAKAKDLLAKPPVIEPYEMVD
jgi:quinol monooxygenase YgiN